MALLATTSLFHDTEPVEDDRTIKMALKMSHHLTHTVDCSQGDMKLMVFIIDQLTRDKHMWVTPNRWIGCQCFLARKFKEVMQ